MDDFSLTSIEQELADQSQNTNQGGSNFKSEEETEQGQHHAAQRSAGRGDRAAATVPVGGREQLADHRVHRVGPRSRGSSCGGSARSWRHCARCGALRTSSICWVMLAFYTVAFSSFSNMGSARASAIADPARVLRAALRRARAPTDRDADGRRLIDAEPGTADRQRLSVERAGRRLLFAALPRIRARPRARARRRSRRPHARCGRRAGPGRSGAKRRFDATASVTGSSTVSRSAYACWRCTGGSK